MSLGLVDEYAGSGRGMTEQTHEGAKRTVAVVFGGRSSEHSISCATASGVLGAIDRDAYAVVPVGVTRDGRFELQEDDPDRFRLRPERLPEIIPGGLEVVWPSGADDRALRVVDGDGRVRHLADIDVVLPLLHGPWGEDGTVQGLFELAGLPFVGSGVLASAAGMDKQYTKILLEAAGLDGGDWTAVTADEWHADERAVGRRVAAYGLPVFVKPARAGSSVGVTRVDEAGDLAPALAAAFEHDSKALVEPAVDGREIELAVLGPRDGSGVRVAPHAGEILVDGDGFYDFDAKYLDNGAARTVCPADVTDAELAALRTAAAHAFTALDCRGLARVDVFLTEHGVVINEVNTMPGFTPISMFPQLWQASGVSYRDLVTDLIEQAVALGSSRH